MQYRYAKGADIKLLAELNSQLVQDEGHPSAFTLEQLEDLWRGWLREDYQAVLFEREDSVVAYALFRPDECGIYLRQFFVRRERRRQGVGRQAMQLLLETVWPTDARVTADVLLHNDPARKFWKSLGFEDYAISLAYRARAGC